MNYLLSVLLGLSSPLTKAQDMPSHWAAPTRGGTEGGIPGLLRPFEDLPSYGFYIASFGKSIDPLRPTHLFLVGPGGASGLLFQLSAVARAHKYTEVFPDHQVLFLASDPFGNGEVQRQARGWGLHILGSVREDLTVEAVFREVSALRAIASIDVFSHANEEQGARLDEFIAPDDRSWQRLRRQFTSDAWGTFHGCNTGWRLAPALSRHWQIPVAGSFTGTHFERLHSRGDFYPYDELLAPPGEFPSINALSYDFPRGCAAGGCLRMKPDAHAYDGRWGSKEEGLNFYKFFCGGLALDACHRRMALAIRGNISVRNLKMDSSLEDFKTVLYDFMCSIHKDKNWRARCIRATENGLIRDIDSYSPFWGRSMQCDFERCRSSRDGEATTTYMNEIKAYLRGFSLLKP